MNTDNEHLNKYIFNPEINIAMDKIESYDKIRGWLWLPALALMVQPIGFVTRCIVPFFRIHAPYVLKINVPILIGDIILLCMTAIVAWLYFSRKKIAPILYIINIIIMVLMWEILDGIIESQNDPPFIAMMFHTLIIMPYLLLSNRVKETFIEELNEKITIERIFMGISQSLLSLYLKMGKKKTNVFIFVILFQLFTILLNCALRSLRIDGDLMHIFNYL
jgi:hypothetical protein